jgi:SAM-dependent methyltransferase
LLAPKRSLSIQRLKRVAIGKWAWRRIMNPWLEIPLKDYEAHMALPNVDQASLLADLFESACLHHAPNTLMLLGCAGGNGLERIAGAGHRRVIAVDINPEYVRVASSRFGKSFPEALFLTHYINRGPIALEPVDLVFAALLFEYVDLELALRNTRKMLAPQGVLVAVLQMKAAGLEAITPSPYEVLRSLNGFMKLHARQDFIDTAERLGFSLMSELTRRTSVGKEFAVLTFRKG